MRFVLLGAPGAGKGTQAVVLAEKYKIPQISTGDIFRSNIKNATELGKTAKTYIDKGQLVPDEVTIDIIKNRLLFEDCKNGFILDGFPRTIPQSQYLDDVLINMGTDLDAVINIYVLDKSIIKRMSGRRTCPNCGATYHTIYNPTKVDGKCDSCGADVIQRDDDREETVVSRLSAYHAQTEPLIEYYKEKGKLITVVGQATIEETTNELLKALKNLFGE